jgi:aubergine-like protein
MNQEPYKHFDLRNWLVIWDGNGPQNAIKDWISCAKRIASQMNVRFSEPMVEVVRSRDFTKQVREILNDYERTQIAVIVVPHGDEGIYYELKRICLEDLGIPSQCLHPNKVMRANMSVVTKVVIQMICKVGGAPWKIDLAEKSLENTMICGLDLHHSGEHVEHKFKKKSVVGFVATLGRSHTTYSSGVSIQDSGTDIAQVVTPLFKRALLAYHKHNSKYPEHVLIYRDGVGITEINKVRQTEWSDIIDLLMDISENKAPDMPPTTELDPVINFNYVVVLKHIQTRFVRAEGGYGNPRAGTVVDVDITLPGVLEFFLIAHHASPGSAAPTRYQVHQNESNFDANFYQNITNKLCSMYYNWFGAIRSPAHCQYAKTLAKLIGQAEIKKDHQDLSNKLFFL